MLKSVYILVLSFLMIWHPAVLAQIVVGGNTNSEVEPSGAKTGVEKSLTRIAYVTDSLISEEKLAWETKEQSVEKIAQKLERNIGLGSIDFILTKDGVQNTFGASR